MTALVEEFENIRRKMEELKALQDMALTGSTLPEKQPEPAYVDYESFCG